MSKISVVRQVTREIQRVEPIISEGQDITEEETRRLIIDPVLKVLGWSVHYSRPHNRKPCITEYFPYRNASVRVDYALFDRSGKEIAIIEAKRLLEDNRDHCRQLKDYSEGLRNAWKVLTNGEFWNFTYIYSRGRLKEEKPLSLLWHNVDETAERLYDALAYEKYHGGA